MSKILNFFSHADAARSVESDPMQKFMFRVSIPSLSSSIKFVTCSPITEEVAVVPYFEGGQQYAYKLAGRSTYEAVTLTRGMYSGTEIEQLEDVIFLNPAARDVYTVELMDRFSKVWRSWRLAEAWVNRHETSDFDANSDDVAIETITVQYEYLLKSTR